MGIPITLSLVYMLVGQRAVSRFHLGLLRGQPSHVRGVAPVAGVYFLGLPWLYTWGSGRFSGVARDAEHVAEHIKARIGRAPADGRAAVNEAAIGS